MGGSASGERGGYGESGYGGSGNAPSLYAEADLLAGVRNADPEAMAFLYEQHRDEALRLARSLMSNRQDAEDVLQEAFAKTVSALRKGYGPSENFGAYLCTRVRSEATAVFIRLIMRRTAATSADDEDPEASFLPAFWEIHQRSKHREPDQRGR
jgi:RNA polymerase sigma factor (sigma-70 family)